MTLAPLIRASSCLYVSFFLRETCFLIRLLRANCLHSTMGVRHTKRRTRTHGPTVRQSDVPWVALPISSASEQVNETTDDGFEGLDVFGDDFLGLQAAEGFDVVHEADESGKNHRVKIVKADPAPKAKAKRRDIQKQGNHKNEHQEASERTSSQQDRGANEAATEAKSRAKTPTIPTTQSHEVPSTKDRKRKASAALDVHDADRDIGTLLQTAREQGMLHEDDAGDDGQEAADAAAPGWASYALHPQLKMALKSLGFHKPTDVQAATLRPSLGLESSTPRDVVGIAQTGSGKTLAYTLPILHYVLEHSAHTEDTQRELEALILTPTRELALQVCTHIRAVVDAAGRFANVATVCGGMSVQKQERMLQQHGGAHVIVATPGRLWDLLKQDDALALRVRRTRFLVIDEADRMIETGHFAEMDSILSMVRRTKGAVADANSAMQTFVYSATMTKTLQANLKRAPWRKKQRTAASSNNNTLDDLLARIDFRDPEPVVIELTPQRHVADTLYEAKIECVGQDKDTYLYYLLLRYQGRTLVFLNAIDGVRRLVPLLLLLGIPAYPLHGQLQQQQRLKNLDRFRRASHAVLLATDVAARGIDIPGVDHVVHFQIPRSADTYVHRAGRTARAGHTGVSVALIEPNELRLWRDLWRTLGRDDRVASLPIEYSFLGPIRERLALAREIDSLSHAQTKASHDDAWLRTLARDADLDYESDASDKDADVDASQRKKQKRSPSAAKLASLKQRLAQLLARPLQAQGTSQKYLTSGVRPEYVQALLSGHHAPHMLGVIKSSIHADLAASKR